MWSFKRFVSVRTHSNSCWGESEAKVINEMQNVAHNEEALLK